MNTPVSSADKPLSAHQRRYLAAKAAGHEFFRSNRATVRVLLRRGLIRENERGGADLTDAGRAIVAGSPHPWCACTPYCDHSKEYFAEIAYEDSKRETEDEENWRQSSNHNSTSRE